MVEVLGLQNPAEGGVEYAQPNIAMTAKSLRTERTDRNVNSKGARGKQKEKHRAEEQ